MKREEPKKCLNWEKLSRGLGVGHIRNEIRTGSQNVVSFNAGTCAKTSISAYVHLFYRKGQLRQAA